MVTIVSVFVFVIVAIGLSYYCYRVRSSRKVQRKWKKRLSPLTVESGEQDCPDWDRIGQRRHRERGPGEENELLTVFLGPNPNTSTKHWLKTKLFSGEAGAGGTRRVVDIGSDNSVQYSRPFFFLLRGRCCTNLHEILAPGLKLIFQTTLFDKNQFWPTVPALTTPYISPKTAENGFWA